jgi:hypothetical protein
MGAQLVGQAGAPEAVCTVLGLVCLKFRPVHAWGARQRGDEPPPDYPLKLKSFVYLITS